jgi:hypothetical protein
MARVQRQLTEASSSYLRKKGKSLRAIRIHGRGFISRLMARLAAVARKALLNLCDNGPSLSRAGPLVQSRVDARNGRAWSSVCRVRM